MPENFERLRQWFENDMVPIKTSEMHSKNKRVGEFMCEVYSMKQMKRKLDATYKDDIIIG